MEAPWMRDDKRRQVDVKKDKTTHHAFRELPELFVMLAWTEEFVIF